MPEIRPTFATIASRPLLASLLVVALGVTSGSLECNARPPLTPTQRRGSALYARMCAVCHGAQGEGYKADQAPALASADFLLTASDEFMRRAIADGRTGTTMSAWSQSRGGPLSRGDVDVLIDFMHSWEDAPRPPLDEHPLTGDAKRGEVPFARECARCHGEKGTGGPNLAIGNPQLLASASNGFLRYALIHGRAKTVMEPFLLRLTPPGIEDVVALLRSWQLPPTATKPAVPPPRIPPLPLGPVPLNPRGPEPIGFQPWPAATPADVIKGQLDRNAKMALLDARAPSDYANEHIAGAVSVPFYDPDPYVSALPRDSWLVAYCACPHAESGQLATKLQKQGFTKVTVLNEGLGVWKVRKYPTTTGTSP